LIDYILFYVPLEIFSLIWRRRHYRWKTARFRPMLALLGSFEQGGIFIVPHSVLTRGLLYSPLLLWSSLILADEHHTNLCRVPENTAKSRNPKFHLTPFHSL
jgi:hypothetical protein